MICFSFFIGFAVIRQSLPGGGSEPQVHVILKGTVLCHKDPLCGYQLPNDRPQVLGSPACRILEYHYYIYFTIFQVTKSYGKMTFFILTYLTNNVKLFHFYLEPFSSSFFFIHFSIYIEIFQCCCISLDYWGTFYNSKFYISLNKKRTY